MKHTPPRQRTAPKGRPGVDFSLRETKQWKYFNGMEDGKPTWLVSAKPHFVLMDGQRRPRFALGYGGAGNYIVIENVQRVTRPNADGRYKEEGYKTQEFKNSLGMSPGCFLVYQFIKRCRNIFPRKGMIYLQRSLLVVYPEFYGPIRNKFFKKNPAKISKWGDIYPLDLKKPIVKLALEQA